MTERSGDRRIRELAADYNRPPPTPREEMWAGIEGALGWADGGGEAPEGSGVHRLGRVRGRGRGGEGGSGGGAGAPPWIAWGSAAAAVLVLGIGIGRLTAPGVDRGGPSSAAPVAGPVAGGASVDGGPGSPIRSVAFRHLDRSESLLTLVRADAGEGRVDPTVGRWARGLLLETRLLLDAAVTSDPELGALLEDLELILAQVVVLEGGDVGGARRAREELRLIADGLRERDVLTRIRTVLSESGSAIL